MERNLRAELTRMQTMLDQVQRGRREADHRIANSLQLAVTLLKMQGRRIADKRAREALAEAEARLLSIAHLHRHLAMKCDGDSVEMSAFLHELCQEIGASLGVDCSVSAEEVEVPATTAKQIAIVVNELVLNALKHAYEGKPGGHVSVTSQRDEEGRLRIVVADGGKGLPDGFSPDQARGLGMSIMTSMLQDLEGILEAETDGGAKFTLTVPLPARTGDGIRPPAAHTSRQPPPQALHDPE